MANGAIAIRLLEYLTARLDIEFAALARLIAEQVHKIPHFGRLRREVATLAEARRGATSERWRSRHVPSVRCKEQTPKCLLPQAVLLKLDESPDISMVGSRLNVRHMRVFHRVVQLGSMAAAARACHLSQAAVTHAIVSLEDLFAARLFERRSKGAVPTAAGEALSKGFQRVLEEIDEAVAQIRRRANGGCADAGRYVRMSHLRALFAVVEHGGFRAALKIRGIRTSRLYCATRELEEVLSVTLFEKTSTGRSPTRDARRFAARCRRALSHLERLRSEIAARSS